MTKQLYINNDHLGSTPYVGTRDEFRAEMLDWLRHNAREALDRIGYDCAMDEETGTPTEEAWELYPDDHDEWIGDYVERTLDDGLIPCDDADAANYAHISNSVAD